MTYPYDKQMHCGSPLPEKPRWWPAPLRSRFGTSGTQTALQNRDRKGAGRCLRTMALIWVLGAALLPAQTPPRIVVDSTSLIFKTGLGQNPDVQTVFVGSSGTALTLQVATTVATGGSWLQYSVDSGTTPANLKVMPQTASLQAGTYQGQIQISAVNAANSPLVIQVTVTVGGGTASTLSAAPAVLNFAAQLNGNPPPAQAITVGPGNSSVGFTVNVSTGSTSAQWLQVSPVSGVTPQILNVSVSAQGLTAGSYTGTINLIPNAQGSGSVSVVVNLTLSALPTLNVSPQQGFQYFFQAGTTSVPAPQGLTLSTTSSTLSLAFQATTGNGLPWLTFGQSQAIVGTTPIQIPVLISPIVATFQPGAYSGAIVITAPGATNASITIPVTLLVSSLPLLSLGNPIGTFNFRAGFPLPQAQNVQIGVSSGQLPYNASVILPPGQNWLTVTPDSGTLPASLSIAVDATGLSSGTYSGQVRVDSPGAANGPLTFPVTLSVSANGLILVSPTELSFNFQIGMAAPPVQPLIIGTTGGTTTFTIQTLTNNCGAGWLTVSPVSGTAPSSVQVSINPAGMAVPTLCSGRVGIVNQTGVQTLVPVNLTVSSDPLLNVAPRIMTFIGPTGGAPPATQLIQLASTDPNNQLFYATQVSTTSGGNWLAVATSSTGQTPASLQVVVNQGTLAPGSYSGVVQINPTGLAPMRVPVTLVVTSNISIGVAPPSISFTTQAGASPGPQVLNITSQGGPVAFSATALSNVNWLSVTPTTATTPAQLIVSASATGLAPANYDGSITISSGQASNPAVTIPAMLIVGQAQNLTVNPLTLAFNAAVGDPAPGAQTITVTPSSGTVDFKVLAEVNGSPNWLKVTPDSGRAPSGITVLVDPTGLAPALYSGTVTITPAGFPQIVVPVTFNVAAPPLPSLSAVVNAASLLDGPIAPGEIVVLTGANTGSGGNPVVAQLNADGSLPLAIGDTQVLFDTYFAPIIAVQTNQVTVVVPYEIAGQDSTLIQVKRKSVLSNPLQIAVTATAPGVFTATVPATKVGAILNADGTPNTADNPALPNSALTVYYTGDGQTSPALTTNAVNPATGTLPAPLLVLTATVGGVVAALPAYGPLPGNFAGISTAKITVPMGLGPGPQPLFLISGSTPSQGGLLVYVSN